MKNGVKDVQAAGFNGTCSVFIFVEGKVECVFVSCHWTSLSGRWFFNQVWNFQNWADFRLKNCLSHIKPKFAGQ